MFLYGLVGTIITRIELYVCVQAEGLRILINDSTEYTGFSCVFASWNIINTLLLELDCVYEPNVLVYILFMVTMKTPALQ